MVAAGDAGDEQTQSESEAQARKEAGAGRVVAGGRRGLRGVREDAGADAGAGSGAVPGADSGAGRWRVA